MTNYITITYENSWKVESYQQEFSSLEEAENWCYDNIDDCVVWHKLDRFTGSLMTFSEWKANCEFGGFIDYDGYCDLIDENFKMIGVTRRPSDYMEKRKDFPENAKYVLWYNR